VLRRPRLLPACLLAAAALAGATLPATTASAAPPAEVAGRWIVTAAPGVDVRELLAQHTRSGGVAADRVYDRALSGFAGTVSTAAVNRLRGDSRVTRVERDGIVRTVGTQVSPVWGLDRMDQASLPLDGAYVYPATGSGVQVHVLDTGVRAHDDLGTRVAAGWSAVSDGNGTDDCHGHGTHVAGTVAGSRYGVAKTATVVPVRVLDCAGSGTSSGVIAGLDWVAKNRSGAAVVNMSLGGTASSSLDDAVRRVVASGVQVVVAAGNETVDACTSSPARVAEALTVGATANSDARASFSNYGSCLDLFAPGASITSLGISSRTATATMSGTSMAAPHVAGAAALVLEGAPSSTPATVASTLLGAATSGVVTGAGTGSPNRLLRATAGVVPPPTTQPVNAVPSAKALKTCSGATCSFDASGSTDSDGTVVSYTWTFSDGPTASGAVVSRTFTGSGTYTGTVRVTDNSGATATASVTASCSWSGKAKTRKLVCG
jgi:subtilisin family serine protease